MRRIWRLACCHAYPVAGAGMGGLAERRLAHVRAKELGNASLAVPQNLRPGHLASSRHYAAMPYPGHALSFWRTC